MKIRNKIENESASKEVLGMLIFRVFSSAIFTSILEYFGGSTVYSTTFEGTSNILYPSISICTNYMFRNGDNIEPQLFSNESLTKKNELILELFGTDLKFFIL